MSLLLSIAFFIVGVVRLIRGAYFIECAICFLISSIFCVAWNINYGLSKHKETELTILKGELALIEALSEEAK